MVTDNWSRKQHPESDAHISAEQSTDEISQLKDEKAKLHASVRRLMLAMEATSDGVWDFDLVTRRAFFSADYAAMIGYSQNELPKTMDAIQSLIHPDDLPLYREQLKQHLQNTAIDFRCQYRMKTKHGEWLWVLSRGKVVEKDDRNTPVRMVGTHTDISYIKKMETTLKESQERFQAVISSSPDPIVIVDEKGTVLYWNDAAKEMTGYTTDEIIGQSFKKLMPAWIESHILRDGCPKRHRTFFQSVLIAKDGREIPVEISMASWTTDGTYFYSALIRDLSLRGDLHREQVIARHQLEQQVYAQTQELQKAHDFLENTFQTVGDAIIVTDAKGIILRVNRTTEEMFGYGAEEMIGKHCNMLSAPGQKGSEIHRTDLLFKTGHAENLRMACRKKNGDIFLGESNIALIRDSVGNIVGMVASVRDITERIHAERALEQSRKRYQDLFNELTDAAFLADTTTGIIIDVNKEAERLMQCPRAELIGIHFSELHPHESREHYRRLFEQCAIQHTTRNIDCEILTKTGTVVPVSINTTTFEQDGKIVMIGLFRDMTEQKLSEKKLRLAYFILNNASEAIVCIDREGMIVFANQAALELLDITPEVLASTPIYRISHASMPRPWHEYWEKNKQERQIVFDAPFERSGKPPLHILVLLNFFEFKEEEYICGFMRDISDIKKVQEDLTREIEERKEIARQLSLREEELAQKAIELEEVNSALKVLLQRTEQSKKEIEEKIIFNMRELVTPYIEKLKDILQEERQKTYLNIIESNILNIVSPFGSKLSVKSARLTPTEMHIANLIKNGCSTKKIADMMGLSNRTIDFHRKNIRKKLGITDRKSNLRSVLMTLD